MMDKLPEVSACYQDEAAKNDQLRSGRVSAQWVVASDGLVEEASIAESNINSTAVEDCIVNEILSWEFPQKKGGGSVAMVNYFDLVRPPSAAETDKIMEHIGDRNAELMACVESQLKADSEANAKVHLSWKISADGTVDNVRVTSMTELDTPENRSCIEDKAKSFTFDVQMDAPLAVQSISLFRSVTQ